jgi:hypothetical protein
VNKQKAYYFLLIGAALFFASTVGVWKGSHFDATSANADCIYTPACSCCYGNCGFDCDAAPTDTPAPTPVPDATPPSCQNTDCTQNVDGVEPCVPCEATPNGTLTGTPAPTDTPPPTATAVPTDTPPPTPVPSPTYDTAGCAACETSFNTTTAQADTDRDVCAGEAAASTALCIAAALPPIDIPGCLAAGAIAVGFCEANYLYTTDDARQALVSCETDHNC